LAHGIREEQAVDKDREAGDYISVSEASQEFNVNKSLIRAAVKRNAVRTMAHPWGLRVLRDDVGKLKVEQERIERERMGG
jgi:hypothetical protein